MSAIINVFASIGLVAILVVIIYYIWKYIDQLNKETQIAQTRPSAAYMQSIGIRCPDYWTYLGNDNAGNYVCRDDKNLMVSYNKNKNAKCISSIDVIYDKDGSTKKLPNAMAFAKLDDDKKWDTMSDDQKIDFMKKTSDAKKYYSRAEWIKTCGPEIGKGVSSQAVWSGLNQYI